MRDFTTVLNHALQMSTFHSVNIRTMDDITTYSFHHDESQVLTAEDLQRTNTTATWDSSERQKTPFIRTRVPAHLLADIQTYLHKLLSDYINDNTHQFGHSFPAFGCEANRVNFKSDGSTEQIRISTVENFALGLIKSAAILGANRVTDLLRGWVAGNPFRYHTYDVLYGISTNHELELSNGIRVTPLPLSSDKLPPTFPKAISVQVGDCLGRSMLQLDWTVSPALFRVSDQADSETEFDFSSPLNGIPPETLLESLSLVCNSKVDFIVGWDAYDDLDSLVGIANHGGARYGSGRSFGRVGRGFSKSFSTGLTKVIEASEPGTGLSLTNLMDAQRLLRLLERSKQSSRRLDTAVSRWMKSMQPQAELTDQLIDMRISLEALYLDNSQGESRFRLATTGAWHIGRDWSERRELQKDLKIFYDIASKAVHGGEVSSRGNREVDYLNRARDICRRGILKAIEQEPMPCWNQLILGWEVERDQSSDNSSPRNADSSELDP